MSPMTTTTKRPDAKVTKKVKKRKPPNKRGPGDIARRPTDCACTSGSFRTTSWGTPVVAVLISQGFTILTVKVPVRFQYTCENTPSGFCRPVLTPHLVKADFGGMNVVTAATGGARRECGFCDGQVNLVNDSEGRFVVVLRTENPNVVGGLELRFTLDDCAGVTARDMFLVISNGKLDPDASDYDGDGKKNADERRGREWDPNG